MILDLVVPRAGSALERLVLPKSAIVRGVEPDGRSRLDYEGNAYGWESMSGFFKRLLHAADRHAQRYPTIARHFLKASEVEAQAVVVGRYDAARFAVTEVFDADALSAWAGEPMEAIVGVKLPPGPITLEQAKAAMVHFPTWTSGSEYLYKTQAGQIVWFARDRSPAVFEHDDPEIRSLVCGRLSPREERLVFGAGRT